MHKQMKPIYGARGTNKMIDAQLMHINSMQSAVRTKSSLHHSSTQAWCRFLVTDEVAFKISALIESADLSISLLLLLCFDFHSLE